MSCGTRVIAGCGAWSIPPATTNTDSDTQETIDKPHADSASTISGSLVGA